MASSDEKPDKDRDADYVDDGTAYPSCRSEVTVLITNDEDALEQKDKDEELRIARSDQKTML